MAKKKKKRGKGLVNRKARFDYEILDTVEAGMVLTGPEVKSLRLGRGSLVDAHVRIMESEAFLINMTIPRYQFADAREYDSTRTRKLLLHKHQIYALEQKSKGENITLVPVRVYEKAGRFKVAVGVAKGRKKHDKREVLKRRDIARETKRAMKNR